MFEPVTDIIINSSLRSHFSNQASMNQYSMLPIKTGLCAVRYLRVPATLGRRATEGEWYMLSFDSGENQILAEAKRLARTYGVDQVRVHRILEQLVPFLLHKSRDLECRLPYDTYWRPPLSVSILEDALVAYSKPNPRARYLDLESDDELTEHNNPKVEDALVLFEENGFNYVASRVLFVECLNHPDTPLYSLEELGDLAEFFICYLQDNRTQLVQTGLPASGPSPSHWLSNRLSRLYYTKYPIGWNESDTVPNAFEYVYAQRTGFPMTVGCTLPPGCKWINCIYPIAAFRDEYHVYLENGSDNWDECSIVGYDRAPYVLVDLATTSRIEKLRERVLDAKLEVLSILRSACTEDGASDVWSQCRKVLQRLNGTDKAVEILLAVDKDYTGYDFRKNRYDSNVSGDVICMELKLAPGGLTDVLEIIGHYENEISVGLLSKLRSILDRLVKHEITDSRRLRFDNYFRILRSGHGTLIEDALACCRRELWACRRGSHTYRMHTASDVHNIISVNTTRPRLEAFPVSADDADRLLPLNDNYTEISIDGERFDFRDSVARAVKVLHKALKGGSLSLSTTLLKDGMGDLEPEKMHNILRKIPLDERPFGRNGKSSYSLRLPKRS